MNTEVEPKEYRRVKSAIARLRAGYQWRIRAIEKKLAGLSEVEKALSEYAGN